MSCEASSLRISTDIFSFQFFFGSANSFASRASNQVQGNDFFSIAMDILYPFLKIFSKFSSAISDNLFRDLLNAMIKIKEMTF